MKYSTRMANVELLSREFERCYVEERMEYLSMAVASDKFNMRLRGAASIEWHLLCSSPFECEFAENLPAGYFDVARVGMYTSS